MDIFKAIGDDLKDQKEWIEKSMVHKYFKREMQSDGFYKYWYTSEDYYKEKGIEPPKSRKFQVGKTVSLGKRSNGESFDGILKEKIGDKWKIELPTGGHATLTEAKIKEYSTDTEIDGWVSDEEREESSKKFFEKRKKQKEYVIDIAKHFNVSQYLVSQAQTGSCYFIIQRGDKEYTVRYGDHMANPRRIDDSDKRGGTIEIGDNKEGAIERIEKYLKYFEEKNRDK